MIMNTTKLMNDDVHINPTALLLNYAFSHPNTSVYLIPITPMVAINHNSARMKDGVQPNAKLAWATWSRKSNYVLQRNLEELKQVCICLEKWHYIVTHYFRLTFCKESSSTLVMDVLAVHDIQPDEEIFIDYGIEWEEAWERHVSNWKSPCKDGQRALSSSTIYRMNHDKHNSDYHDWTADHFSLCSKRDLTQPHEAFQLLNNEKLNTVSRKRFAVVNQYEGIDADHEGFLYVQSSGDRYPCRVRNNDYESFIAILFLDHYVIEVYEDMPSTNVYFVPKPYKSNLHLPSAFRHDIKIPDDIFPKHWFHNA
jgi:hypothetical protein